MKIVTMLFLFLMCVGCELHEEFGIQPEILEVDPSTENMFGILFNKPKTFEPVCIGKCPSGLDAAIDGWNNLVGVDFISDQGEMPIFFFEATAEEILNIGNVISPDSLDRDTVGITQITMLYEGEIGCGIHYLASRSGSEALLAHEIGHCLLFEHSTNPDSIMYKDYGNYFTTALQALARVAYLPQDEGDGTIETSDPIGDPNGE